MEEVRTVGNFSADEKSRFIGRTYGWMALALFVSAASAFAVASSETMLRLIFGHGIGGWLLLAVAEIGLVIWLTASIRKISVGAAMLGFIAYAVLNGATLSSIFIVYKIDSIASAFFTTALLFTVMS
ncbi:MAG: Bax inhibitor-1 family protein, partial [Treponemataceae bacterium]|nr:Bax inhibitor-1 family protein [Treponemataceae bacterium]